jgi:PIN domain nuclease of toxin-antitoxin system
MGVLFDTAALIRWLEGPDVLGANVIPALQAAPASGPPIVVSVASLWEIAIKSAVGKLEAPADLPERLAAHPDFSILAITPAHAWSTRTLPLFKDHRDPFDRLLAAQALVENLTVATPDSAFARYGVSVIW